MQEKLTSDVNKNWDSFSKVSSLDFSKLKSELLNTGEKIASFGRCELFDQHLGMLEKEFSSSSKLEFYHAWLIVNLRRKIDIEQNIKMFYELWQFESDFLLEKLSSRWLISACDTIIDYSDNLNEKSISIAAVLLMNTIKLYESEKLMYDQKRKEENFPIGRIDLFDGMTAYVHKSGDMVSNMIERLFIHKDIETTSWKILMELIHRIHRENTVYARMAELNINKWYKDEQFSAKKF